MGEPINHLSMKIHILILLFGLFQLNQLYCQKPFNCDASINNEAAINVTTWEGATKVYEGTRNNVLPSNQRCYFIAPSFKLKTIDGTHPQITIPYPGYLQQARATLIVKFSSKESVLEAVRKRNPDANIQSIYYLTNQDIVISHSTGMFNDFIIEHKSIQPIGNQQIPFPMNFFMNDEKLFNMFVENLRNGQEDITIKVAYREAEIKVRSLSINYSTLLNCNSYREYKQDVINNNKKVIANQIYNLSLNIVREFNVEQWDEILQNDETDFLKATDNIYEMLMNLHQKTFINVNDITNLISNYKIDLNSKHFQPSYITEFACDVKNISKQEFQNKYVNDYKNYYKNEYKSHNISDKSSEKAGEGGFQIWKIKIGGSGSSKWHNLSDNELSRLAEGDFASHFNNENSYRSDIDNSYKYSWKGEKIERLEIAVYEPINLDIKIKGIENMFKYKVMFGQGWSTIIIKSSDIAYE